MGPPGPHPTQGARVWEQGATEARRATECAPAVRGRADRDQRRFDDLKPPINRMRGAEVRCGKSFRKPRVCVHVSKRAHKTSVRRTAYILYIERVSSHISHISLTIHKPRAGPGPGPAGAAAARQAAGGAVPFARKRAGQNINGITVSETGETPPPRPRRPVVRGRATATEHAL